VSDNHQEYMRHAIVEALKGKGTAEPNPIVGAVIVEDQKIVASGYHVRPGKAHAEINAITNLGRSPKEGASLYVTLEPCSTKGRTGKCTDAIIRAGLVLGAVDPNPDHNGQGISILKEAGIEVVMGVLEGECEQLNVDFNERMKARNL